jgi:hypothetical protein
LTARTSQIRVASGSIFGSVYREGRTPEEDRDKAAAIVHLWEEAGANLVIGGELNRGHHEVIAKPDSINKKLTNTGG